MPNNPNNPNNPNDPKKPNKPNNKPSKQPDKRTSANRRFAERQAAKEQAARAARQRRNRMVGLGSIVLVLVIVVVFVVVKATGGGSGGGGGSSASGASPAAGTPVATSITSKLTSIPLSTLAAASTSGLDTPTHAISDPALTADGKPDLLYIGAEFCPYCAAERWALYVALSKLGTFSPQPGRIHSAVADGDIPTLTFYKTSYSSPYLTFTSVENTTNAPVNGSYPILQTPTAAEKNLWDTNDGGSYPFVDFGGKVDLTSSQYDPQLLEGKTFDQIASDIGDNSTSIGADIDASAKVLLQTICGDMTSHKPAAVCSAVGDG
jgi:hypothetical protein